ncbi:MAG: 3-isopropylmalate dehydratase [Thermoplasmata archaeon]|nr:MAG: 3-isopropylmalate dehydratase [Thermoplasmata archaeon]
MGRVWKYGDDVNTDVIFPGRYLHIVDADEMAKHAMEDLDPEFARGVKEGDVIVAGKNFGCGSSREQAAICLRRAGITAIIAKSFARIFYRNAINQGILALTSDDVHLFSTGDDVEVDVDNWVVKNKTKGVEVKVDPLPEFIMEIIKDGGLVEHVKKKIGK